MNTIGNDFYRRPVISQQGSCYSWCTVIERRHGIEDMRRMARPPINGSDGLFVGCIRVANARQDTQPGKRCQETSFLIFFRRVINDADPATAGCRQFLHFSSIRRTDPWIELCPFLCPANKWTFQAQAQYLSGRSMYLVFRGTNDSQHLLYRLRPADCRNCGKERCHPGSRKLTSNRFYVLLRASGHVMSTITVDVEINKARRQAPGAKINHFHH